MMKIDEDRMLNRADPMGLPSWIPNHMKQMMSRMHSSMNQMLDNLKEDMPNMLGKSTSGGKLVMINSGPGYHEEKTYNIGTSLKCRSFNIAYRSLHLFFISE